VSRSAHDCAMIRFHSTMTITWRRVIANDPAPRHIEPPAPATTLTTWLGWPPVATSSAPLFELHLDDGIWHCFGCGQTRDVVVVCQSEGVGWRQTSRILDSAGGSRARGPHTNRRPPRRDFSSSDSRREVLRDPRGIVEMTVTRPFW